MRGPSRYSFQPHQFRPRLTRSKQTLSCRDRIASNLPHAGPQVVLPAFLLA
jgi:hypothetical protein